MSFKVMTLKFLVMSENYTSKHKKKLSPMYVVYVAGRLPESEFAALAPFPLLLFLIHDLQWLEKKKTKKVNVKKKLTNKIGLRKEKYKKNQRKKQIN